MRPEKSFQNPSTIIDCLQNLWFISYYIDHMTEEGWHMMCPQLKHRKCPSAGNSTSPGQRHSGSGNCLTHQVDHTDATVNVFEHIICHWYVHHTSRSINDWIYTHSLLDIKLYDIYVYVCEICVWNMHMDSWATKTILVLHVDNLDG